MDLKHEEYASECKHAFKHEHVCENHIECECKHETYVDIESCDKCQCQNRSEDVKEMIMSGQTVCPTCGQKFNYHYEFPWCINSRKFLRENWQAVLFNVIAAAIAIFLSIGTQYLEKDDIWNKTATTKIMFYCGLVEYLITGLMILSVRRDLQFEESIFEPLISKLEYNVYQPFGKGFSLNILWITLIAVMQVVGVFYYGSFNIFSLFCGAFIVLTLVYLPMGIYGFVLLVKRCVQDIKRMSLRV